MDGSGWTCSLDELTRATGGQVKSEVFKEFHRVGTDSRQTLEHMLFIPLKGANYDAHDFVPQAVAQKARIVLVHQWREEWRPLLNQATFVQVADTLQALQDLAHYWRQKQGFKVLAITGSNGKTSAKEFTFALLKDWAPTHATKGSYNNHWGVPLTILAAGPEHKILILEMGMNKTGEIRRLCEIAEPDVVVVTSVGRAHVGELGSQAQVAAAKEEIYISSPKAIHAFNLDNEWTMAMQVRSRAQQIKFSAFRSGVDIQFRAQRLNWDGLDLVGHIRGCQGQTWVHVLGRQNTVNLMVAASLALAVGLKAEDIWKGLGTIRGAAWGRNQLLSLKNGANVLFDGYNANPDSMQALLKNLYEIDIQGNKFLVLGDMAELGVFSAAAHEELGERAAGIGSAGIWYVGANAQAFSRGVEKAVKPKIFVTSAGYDPAISKMFSAAFQPGDLVAVKGSRGMHLETVVESWPLLTPMGEKP